MKIIDVVKMATRNLFRVSKFLTFILLLIFVLSAVLGTTVPLFLGRGMSMALGQQSVQTFLLMTAIFCFLWFLASGIKYLAYPLYGKLEQKAQSAVAVDALATSYAAEKRGRSEQEDSEIAFAIDAQMTVFREVFSTLALSLVPAATVLVTGTLSLWSMGGWQTALIYMGGLIGFIFASAPLVRQHQKAQGEFFSASMENFGILSTAVGYWKEVAVFGLTHHMSGLYRASRVPVEEKGAHSYRMTRRLYLFQSAFLALLLFAILTVYMLVNQDADPYQLVGGFIALAGVCLYSIQAIQNVAFDFSALASSYAQYEESIEKIQARVLSGGEQASAVLNFSPLVGVTRGVAWVRGDSGSGKSRSLEALLGFNTLLPVGGFETQGFSELRYLPQASNLTFETAIEIVRAGRKYLDADEISNLLRTLGLADFAEGGTRSATLLGGFGAVSGGEARRIALARTLLGSDGALLVLDEPTTGVGSKHRAIVWKLVREVARENLVLVVTHDSEAPVLPGDILLDVPS